VCNIRAGSVGLTSGDGRTITWSAFDKPLTISQGSNISTMTYGP
jgi:hypothetical protein